MPRSYQGWAYRFTFLVFTKRSKQLARYGLVLTLVLHSEFGCVSVAFRPFFFLPSRIVYAIVDPGVSLRCSLVAGDTYKYVDSVLRGTISEERFFFTPRPDRSLLPTDPSSNDDVRPKQNAQHGHAVGVLDTRQPHDAAVVQLAVDAVHEVLADTVVPEAHTQRRFLPGHAERRDGHRFVLAGTNIVGNFFFYGWGR